MGGNGSGVDPEWHFGRPWPPGPLLGLPLNEILLSNHHKNIASNNDQKGKFFMAAMIRRLPLFSAIYARK